MFSRLNILLTGRSKDDLLRLQSILQNLPGVTLATRNIQNGHADPLHEVAALPDILIFIVSESWREELAAVMQRPLASRPPMLIVGPGDNVELLWTAMRAGARDFLSLPVEDEDVALALKQIVLERLGDSTRELAHLTVVINAKGGSGASLVASNLAHVVATAGSNRTLLVDMDLQFGCLPTYLNVTPRNGLFKALELVETLDAVAIEGYVQSHPSGLDILAAAPDSIVLPQDVDDARVTALFDVLAQAYDYLIVDLPRYIETASASVLDRADRILVVTQQSIAHLRDTRRLMSILQGELGIAGERLVVLVNRLDKKSAVSLSDIRTALQGLQIRTLPNDYRRVTESINLGVPLLELGRRTVIAKHFADLADVVRPQSGGETKNAPAHGGASFLHWLGN